MQLARYLNKLFQKDGFLLIDANSNKYIIVDYNKNKIQLKSEESNEIQMKNINKENEVLSINKKMYFLN